MSFEVGKKYVGSTDGRLYPEVYECVYKDKDGIVLKGSSGGLSAHEYKNYGALYGYFVEHKESRSITRWQNVWEKPNGELSFSGFHHSEKDAKFFGQNSAKGGWKLLDTIKVKWTEKT